MDKYLKMADVFKWQEIQLPESWSHGMVTHAAHAINSHDELVEISKNLLSKLKEIDECFEAAYIDGLSDAFSNEDINTIKDIYCRRIDFARSVAIAAISKEIK